jgi:predicted nucleotidyltransferase
VNADHFSEDVREFFRLLHTHAVRYVLVGGEAVIYYGYARLTGDVDFFYEPTPENTARLFEALREFWGGDVPGVGSAAELCEPAVVVQFGRPPNRIDLLSTVSGIDFGAAWTSRIEERVGEVPVFVIGLEALIQNKAAAARDRDRDDLDYLRRKSRASC